MKCGIRGGLLKAVIVMSDTWLLGVIGLKTIYSIDCCQSFIENARFS